MKLPVQPVFLKIPDELKTGLKYIWEELVKVINVKVDIQTYTEATKPAATEVPVKTIIYVSDGGVADKMRYSDGTAWRTLG